MNLKDIRQTGMYLFLIMFFD